VAKKKRTVKSSSKKLVRASKGKLSLVMKRFFISLILSIISFALFSVASNVTVKNILFLISFVAAFVAAAFLIVLLVLLFMRGFKK
jgi:hypothetical protein